MNLKRQEEGDVLTKYYHKLNIYFINISLYSQRIALAVVQVKITMFVHVFVRFVHCLNFNFLLTICYYYTVFFCYHFVHCFFWHYCTVSFCHFCTQFLFVIILYTASCHYCTLFPFVIVVHCFLSSTFLYTAILSFCTMFPFVIVVHFPFENSVRCFLLSFSNTLCSIYNILKALHIISIYWLDTQWQYEP